MGAFYANIALKGIRQQQAVDFLTAENRDSWVTPTVNDITVVYDSKLTRGCDGKVLIPLTEGFSQALDCVALGVSVYDSDILQYALYQSGELIDTYHSAPNYWHCGSMNAPPEGGDAIKICAAFNVISSMPTVEAYLPESNPSLFEEYDNRAEVAVERMKSAFSCHPSVFHVNEILHTDYIFEEKRHADLVGALGLPFHVVCAGYEMFNSKEPLAELAKIAVIKTGS